MDNNYQCSKCKGIFEKGQTDEAAEAEIKTNGFDVYPKDEMCIVCEDCYKGGDYA